jgi:hypothetical protein
VASSEGPGRLVEALDEAVDVLRALPHLPKRTRARSPAGG